MTAIDALERENELLRENVRLLREVLELQKRVETGTPYPVYPMPYPDMTGWPPFRPNGGPATYGSTLYESTGSAQSTGYAQSTQGGSDASV